MCLEINLISPRFSGHPDLVDKSLSPEGVPKSGSDCNLQTGYWSLCAAVNRALRVGIPVTCPEFMASMTKEQLATILRSDTGRVLSAQQDRTSVSPNLENTPSSSISSSRNRASARRCQALPSRAATEPRFLAAPRLHNSLRKTTVTSHNFIRDPYDTLMSAHETNGQKIINYPHTFILSISLSLLTCQLLLVFVLLIQVRDGHLQVGWGIRMENPLPALCRVEGPWPGARCEPGKDRFRSIGPKNCISKQRIKHRIFTKEETIFIVSLTKTHFYITPSDLPDSLRNKGKTTATSSHSHHTHHTHSHTHTLTHTLTQYCSSQIKEPTDTSKQPIKTRYLGHVTGYQPIRDQYFLNWSKSENSFQLVVHYPIRITRIYYCKLNNNNILLTTPNPKNLPGLQNPSSLLNFIFKNIARALNRIHGFKPNITAYLAPREIAGGCPREISRGQLLLVFVLLIQVRDGHLQVGWGIRMENPYGEPANKLNVMFIKYVSNDST
eukprot:sb/3464133/